MRLKSDLKFWLEMNSREIGGFAVPYGPWGFNSWMDVRDVSRKQAVALNLIAEDEKAKPIEAHDFNRELEASVSDLSPELQSHLHHAFGDQVTISRAEIARWTKEPQTTKEISRNRETPLAKVAKPANSSGMEKIFNPKFESGVKFQFLGGSEQQYVQPIKEELAALEAWTKQLEDLGALVRIVELPRSEYLMKLGKRKYQGAGLSGSRNVDVFGRSGFVAQWDSLLARIAKVATLPGEDR